MLVDAITAIKGGDTAAFSFELSIPRKVPIVPPFTAPADGWLMLEIDTEKETARVVAFIAY